MTGAHGGRAVAAGLGNVLSDAAMNAGHECGSWMRVMEGAFRRNGGRGVRAKIASKNRCNDSAERRP